MILLAEDENEFKILHIFSTRAVEFNVKVFSMAKPCT